MKLVFMGTPEFALPALKALVDAGHEISAIYTQPPRRAGRGKNLKKSPVHELGDKLGVEVKTPIRFSAKKEQEEFSSFNADAAIVAAYGLILPSPVLKAFRYGCINIHPSLLPRWRGAAPIQRAVMAGDTETGVAIMQLSEGLDSGDIFMMQKVAIPHDATFGSMHDVLSQKGANMLIKALKLLDDGEITPNPQREDGVTYAKKVEKSEGDINWNLPANEIYNAIRGLAPYPAAFFRHNGEKIKVLEARPIELDDDCDCGIIIDDSLTISCGGKSSLKLLKIQKAGKKAMDIESFLRGNNIPAGTRLDFLHNPLIS